MTDDMRLPRPLSPARRHSSARPGRLGRIATVVTLAATGVAVAASPGLAQGIPGLVISTPPPAPGTAPPAPTAIPGMSVVLPSAPPAAAPPAAPPPVKAKPAAVAKPKPKPKPTATKQAKAEVPSGGSGKGSTAIVALVNDEPITGFEVERRQSFMSLQTDISDRARAAMKAIAENPRTNERLKAILEETIRANPGKTREQVIAAFEERKKQFIVSLQRQAIENARAGVLPALKKKALDELIDEKLKLQEAKKMTIAISDDEVEKMFKTIADRNKMTSEQFAQHIRSQGADPADMKARFKATLAWRDVIRRRFGHMISVSQREVEQALANSPSAAEALTELQLQKITLSMPGKLDQKQMARRLQDAEQLRGRFMGCKSTGSLAAGVANAKFEDLGFRKATSVPESTRGLLIAAGDGEMIPAHLTAAGVELYAVCGRRTVKVDEEKRQAAESELQMKEFDRLAQRHLFDLRKDSLIEIR